MYIWSMRRGTVGLIGMLASALACQSATVTRAPASSQTQTSSTRAIRAADPLSARQAEAVAITKQTLSDLRRFGFAVDGTSLHVQVAREDAFVDGLAKNATHFEMPGQFDALSAIARLFGMSQGRSPDELKALARLAVGEATLAYYDHVAKTLVARDDADARMLSLESLIAHELAHAYQDQTFGLEAFIRAHRQSLDSLRAAHGILEGQAVVVGSGLEWSRRGVSIDRLDPDLADTSVGRLSAGEAFSVIYESGRRLVLLRYREGGWAAVRDVLANPPTSTEQLLHPQKFRRDLPTDVTLPATPKSMTSLPIVFDGTLGELLLYNRLLLVAKDVTMPRHAAAGWDGDRLRVYGLADGGYAVAWRILWDRASDARQFEQVVFKSLAGRMFVGLTRHDRVTDLVYSDLQAHFEPLRRALSSHRPQFYPSTFDAESTAAVERVWELAEQRRPYVSAGRWFLPEYGLSFQVPDGYAAVTMRGVDLLAAMPQEGFASNVSLVYEQDLFGGDLEQYLREARDQTRMTSQRWLSHQTIRLGQSQAAIVELEIAGDRYLMSAAMLVFPRNGRWVTITGAALASERGRARTLLDGIVRTLQFE